MANKHTPDMNDKALSNNETILVTINGISHDTPLLSKEHSCSDSNATDDILTGLLTKYDILSNLSCSTHDLKHKSETQTFTDNSHSLTSSNCKEMPFESYTFQGIVDLDKKS